jgi:hypothetical protein
MRTKTSSCADQITVSATKGKHVADNNAQDIARANADRVKRLALIGLSPSDVTAPPVVLEAGQTFVFSSENPAANMWMLPLKAPVSLDELKEIVGVPNRIFEHNDTKHITVYPDVQNAPLREGDPFALTDESSLARRTAVNLVYGYADPVYVAQPTVQALTKLMCSALEGQFAVVGTDLVVKDGATVDLGNNPVVQFDTVTIYGTGQIIVHSNQKVQATSITWKPAERGMTHG